MIRKVKQINTRSAALNFKQLIKKDGKNILTHYYFLIDEDISVTEPTYKALREASDAINSLKKNKALGPDLSYRCSAGKGII